MDLAPNVHLLWINLLPCKLVNRAFDYKWKTASQCFELRIRTRFIFWAPIDMNDMNKYMQCRYKLSTARYYWCLAWQYIVKQTKGWNPLLIQSLDLIYYTTTQKRLLRYYLFILNIYFTFIHLLNQLQPFEPTPHISPAFSKDAIKLCKSITQSTHFQV